MALRVRYEQTIIVFFNMIFCIEIVVWKKGYSKFDFMCQARVNFSVTNHYSSTPEVSFLFLFYEIKSQKNGKNHFLLLGSIHKRRKSLFFLLLSRWEETKALILCWVFVRVSLEWAPIKVDANKRIFFRRLRAVYPRLTLVIESNETLLNN